MKPKTIYTVLVILTVSTVLIGSLCMIGVYYGYYHNLLSDVKAIYHVPRIHPANSKSGSFSFACKSHKIPELNAEIIKLRVQNLSRIQFNISYISDHQAFQVELYRNYLPCACKYHFSSYNLIDITNYTVGYTNNVWFLSYVMYSDAATYYLKISHSSGFNETDVEFSWNIDYQTGINIQHIKSDEMCQSINVSESSGFTIGPVEIVTQLTYLKLVETGSIQSHTYFLNTNYTQFLIPIVGQYQLCFIGSTILDFSPVPLDKSFYLIQDETQTSVSLTANDHIYFYTQFTKLEEVTDSVVIDIDPKQYIKSDISHAQIWVRESRFPITDAIAEKYFMNNVNPTPVTNFEYYFTEYMPPLDKNVKWYGLVNVYQNISAVMRVVGFDRYMTGGGYTTLYGSSSCRYPWIGVNCGLTWYWLIYILYWPAIGACYFIYVACLSRHYIQIPMGKIKWAVMLAAFFTSVYSIMTFWGNVTLMITMPIAFTPLVFMIMHMTYLLCIGRKVISKMSYVLTDPTN